MGAVEAGAQALHVHPRNRQGAQSLTADDQAAALTAIRVGCPGVPVGVTTAAAIESDPGRRAYLVANWGELPPAGRPDFASVNFSETGAVDLCRLLARIGIGYEPGLATVADAELLVESGLAEGAVRLLVETPDEDAAAAVRSAEAIDAILDAGAPGARRLYHGFGPATWAVIRYGLGLGRDVRIGLEDTGELEDGQTAEGNAALVAAVGKLAAETATV